MEQNNSESIQLKLTGIDLSPNEIEAKAISLEKEIVSSFSNSQVNISDSVRGKGDVEIFVGSVLLSLLPVALPKVLEFLNSWALRKENHNIRIKIQSKGKAIELDVPQTTSQEEVKQWIRLASQSLTSSSHTK